MSLRIRHEISCFFLVSSFSLRGIPQSKKVGSLIQNLCRKAGQMENLETPWKINSFRLDPSLEMGMGNSLR